MKRKIGLALLILFAVAAIAALFLTAPLPQNQEYHHFADNRMVFAIPNFWNVVTNLPFLIIGIMGLGKLNVFDEKLPYAFFFLGIALVSIGSGFYHINPNDVTLVWDRLPMTIGFMSLFTIIIREFVDIRWGRRILLPLIVIGILSIVYWVIIGDLRFYLLVQFYPLIATPVALLFFRSQYNKVWGYWALLAFYVLAKVAEIYDQQIFEALHFSGHSIKHLLAAVGIFVIYHTYMTRQLKRTI
jgi:hypothetical protein